MNYDVVVIGAGAAGLLAAAAAAARGRRTLLLEKNRRPGVKILMSGGTRCNLTHATDKWGIIRAYGEQGNFLHSALAALSPADLVKLIEDEGVLTKVEETGKIFPVSNRAADVCAALLRRLEQSGATLALAEPVTRVTRSVDGGFRVVTSHRELAASAVLITVGGQSYPGSGTCGDGYAWAAAFGHTIVPPRPALVPLTTNEPWVRDLSGITVPDVTLKLWCRRLACPDDPPLELWCRRLACPDDPPSEKPLDNRRGSLLFTHFGLSGPVVLDISRSFTALADPAGAHLLCDFTPDTTTVQLDEQLRRAAASDGKRQVAGILSDRLPRRLIEALLTQANIRADVRAAEFSRHSRAALVAALKSQAIPVTGTRGFAQAEVTAGGVSLTQIDSRNMQSKLVPGLYFAGEILDLDGPIGGYNFQAAFSTGLLAGQNV